MARGRERKGGMNNNKSEKCVIGEKNGKTEEKERKNVQEEMKMQKKKMMRINLRREKDRKSLKHPNWDKQSWAQPLLNRVQSYTHTHTNWRIHPFLLCSETH